VKIPILPGGIPQESILQMVFCTEYLHYLRFVSFNPTH